MHIASDGIQVRHRKAAGEPPAYGAKAAFDMQSEGKDDKLPPPVFRRHIVFK